MGINMLKNKDYHYKKWNIVFLFTLCMCCQTFTQGNKLEVMTDSTFDKIVDQQSDKFILVFFTHSNCKVCVKYENELKRMIADKSTSETAIYKVDCLNERNLKGRFDIDYFPFIVLIKQKRFAHYQGQASSDQINSFIQNYKLKDLQYHLENMKPIPDQLEFFPFLFGQIIKRLGLLGSILKNKIFLSPFHYLIPLLFVLVSNYLTNFLEDYEKSQTTKK